MQFPTRIANHPIHPMLIPFPIALWISSFVGDLVYVWTGSSIWSDISLYAMVGGNIGAVGAAIFGLADFLKLSEPHIVKIGTWHMIINVVVLLLFLINWFLRFTGGRPGVSLILLSAIGVVLLAVSGWLGGELVYSHGVAVSRSNQEPKVRKVSA